MQKIEHGQYYMDDPTQAQGMWAGTLQDLLDFLAKEHGGDMNTRILIESDGEPLYFTVPMEGER